MALAFRPKVINQPIHPSVHLWRAAAVIMTATAEAFVRVLVGFDGCQAALRRLPAMVRVVEVSNSGVKMSEKRAESQKKSFSAPIDFGNGPLDGFVAKVIK